MFAVFILPAKVRLLKVQIMWFGGNTLLNPWLLIQNISMTFWYASFA